MGIAQALIGVFSAVMMMIPGLPEMVESTLPLYPGRERQINDLSAGIYNAFLGLGQVIAPLVGAGITQAYGFQVTTDVIALICLVFGVIYFALGNGVEAIR